MMGDKESRGLETEKACMPESAREPEPCAKVPRAWCKEPRASKGCVTESEGSQIENPRDCMTEN